MTILKRKTKSGKTRYRARFYSKGNSTYKTFEKKSEAKKWLELQGERSRAGLSVVSDITLDEYVGFWLKELGKRRELKTVKGYHSDMNNWVLPVCGGLKIGEIGYNHGIIVRDSIVEAGLSTRTANKVLIAFKSVLEFATKGQYPRRRLVSNPLRGIELFKKTEKKLVYWDRDLARDFLEKSKGDDNWFLYFLALNTGMRLGELAGLRHSNIKFDEGVIEINGSLKRTLSGDFQKGSTKGKRVRFFPISQSLRAELEGRVKTGDDFVFQNKNGKHIDIDHFCQRVFRKKQRELSFKPEISFHNLRDSFASIYMMSGGDIFDLKELLGHADINTTLVYAHLSKKHLSEKIKGFEI